MQIEISNEGDKGYKIYTDGNNHPLRNNRTPFYLQFHFSDDDIINLIGENKYNNQLEKGSYKFNVSTYHLKLITGERSAMNRSELAMYNN